MGSIQSFHFHHDINSWNSEYGCDHYNSETVIKEIKWKVVPVSTELSKKLFRRMISLVGSLTVEGTSGLKSKGVESKHDIIQCGFHCDTCHKDRYITIELWPEGGVIHNGKYTTVYKTKDSKFTKDYNFGMIERALNTNKDKKFDILNKH